MMKIDRNVFFREATLRICSSLDIDTALKKCYEYIKRFIPITQMSLYIVNSDLNLVQYVASAGAALPESYREVLPLPEKGQKERAALFKTRDAIHIFNKVDLELPEFGKLGAPELQKTLGLNPEISAIAMRLRLEGNLVGELGLISHGSNQYTEEHAQLLGLLNKPFAIAMSNALTHREVIRLMDMLADDKRYLINELRSALGDEVIGSDFGLKEVMTMVQQVAPLDSPVLLLGETGTGKEVIANAIHSSSSRKDGPFIKVNCGAIPETLIDSELFGHEKGAFTGALSLKRGRFERADKGTIFLDEIGELPSHAQVRLLHVLQRKEFERVGGTRSIPVDIRIISATNRNLEEMVASGRFREDLWFRLNVFPITIPPLRKRKEDIPALVHHFIDRKFREMKLRERPTLALGAMGMLIAYDWPGNVRELENMVERALILHRGGALSFKTLLSPAVSVIHEAARDVDRNQALSSLDEITAKHIRQAMETCRGKINGPGGVAQILGLHPNTLRKRMNKLGIPFGRKSWQSSISQS